MTKFSFTTTRTRSNRESGQAMVFILLGLGIFLLGAIAFAVDLGNLWFNRQSAQTAADAACAAGAMDLLLDGTNGTNNQGGFTAAVNTKFDCNGNTTASPCLYAGFNGYSSTVAAGSTALGNNVSVSFPASVPGVVTPPVSVAATPFMRVDVTNNQPTFFAGMLGGITKQTVRAFAVCGVAQATAPIPIVILDPHNPTNKTSAFDIQGSPTVTIYGGPGQSIQVNSDDPAAVNIGGNAQVDLSQGGPAHTGSSFGTLGGPFATPAVTKNFNPGTTGQWLVPSPTINDPFQQLAAPSLVPSAPAAIPIATGVAPGVRGCAADSKNTCDEYAPGFYASGICVGTSCPGKFSDFAIFQPGIYYLGGNLTALSNSCLRISTAAGQGIGGVMFYLSGSATVQINSNSGTKCDPAQTFVTQPNGAGPGSLPYGVGCAASTQYPGNLPATLTGNVLLAPCTGTYGDTYLAAGNTPPASIGPQRGMLFFQDRSSKGQTSSAGGGGSYVLAGTMYFHSCNSTGTGTNCGSTPTYWSNSLQLQGGSGSSTYVLGQIIVDNLQLGGNSGIYMDLNPSSAFTVLKASLYQ
ncbi:MAG: hypothetical protein JWO20_826 [Candidatus Angelobacter sp.]|nr:hypothetical protein [Candidatus Angelobacter sp.]